MTKAHKSNHSPIERVPNHHSPLEGESQKPSRQATADVVVGTEPSGGKPNHSPLEGESANQEPVPGLTGEQGPQVRRWGETR